MTDLSAFAITRQFPAEHPDRLQFYAAPTPNGVKVSILLEELGLPYEPHFVAIGQNASWTPEYLSLNPNGKIPAILDPDGPGGQPFALFESGAILIYLAEKTGRFLSSDPAARYQTIQWLMFQMGGLGPMFGQLNFFARFAGKAWEDKRPQQRYADESKRLLGVLETRLDGREWLVDDYSIADIATIGWVRAIASAEETRALAGYGDFPRVAAWLDRALARPAVARGLQIPARPPA